MDIVRLPGLGGCVVLGDRVEDAHRGPECATLRPETIVHWVDLVCVVRRLIREDEHKRVGVAALDHRPVRWRGHADVPLPDALDRAQRSQTGGEPPTLSGL